MTRPSASAFAAFAEELERRFDAGVAAPWPPGVFQALALEAFARQFERIPAYRGFCEGRGRTPSDVSSWQEVPAVPATAFKHIELLASESGRPEAVFRTSGTTRGAEARGSHLVPSLSLYRHSLLPPFAAHVLAGRERIRFVSLIPSPAEQPDSSLSFMVGVAAEALATETHWLVDAGGALHEEGLRTVMRHSSHGGEPVLLLGTALALLHVVERLEASPTEPLPPGSRIMETGGFKGIGREIVRAELYDRLSRATGLAPGRVVSEYGMTELLSQLYDPVLSEGPASAGVYVAPPWLRVRAVDPVTLEDVRPGELGLLTFFDLANAGSVCHVLTEDVGSVEDGRVRLRGRAEGAEPRGCSRAMDELMSEARSVGRTRQRQ